MFEKEISKLTDEIANRISKRVNDNSKAFDKLDLQIFYVCGGALLEEEPNDYDLFPVFVNDFDKYFTHTRGVRYNKICGKIWETPNACTYNIDGVVIQLCKFPGLSLKDTVERFDFTHCKVGVEFKKIKRYKSETYIYAVKDIYVSEDFIKYKIKGYSEYTGHHEGDYPLSSLLRVFKYYKRGYIKSPYDVIFKILESFLERKYFDEIDFFEQLAGIDIGVDEAQGIDDNEECLKHIYYLLTGKVIKNWDICLENLSLGTNPNR